ncbi:MAG: MucR family transcriptional regulator [Sphingobium sp.]|nr:MucR family transcriptional regulator [Sphingobium sp.]
MARAKPEAVDAAAEKSALSAAIAKDGEVLRIPVEDIEMGDRLRPVDEDWAMRLGEMMLVDGQRDPIWVCRLPGRNSYTLVAGAHRYTAHCIFPELGPIKAIVVDSDRMSRIEGEVIENLHRKGLDPVERATFIAELVSVKKLRMGIDPAKDGRAASIAARWQQQVQDEAEDTKLNISLVYGWNEQVAEEVGLSLASVKNDITLIRRLSPAVIDLLRQHKHHILTNASQLRALAKSEPGEQLKAAEKLCGVNRDAAEMERPLPKTLAEAIALVKARDGVIQPVRTPEQKRFNKVLDALKAMAPAERRALFQSPAFHDEMPPEAARLLASMRRGGSDAVQDDDDEHPSTDRDSGKAGLAGNGGVAGSDRDVAIGGAQHGRQPGEGQLADGMAVATGSRLSGGDPAPARRSEPQQPALPIRQSVKPDYIACLECGERHTKLRAHLTSAHQIAKADYLAKWKLPADYPLVAPNFAQAQYERARKLGLKGPKGGAA